MAAVVAPRQGAGLGNFRRSVAAAGVGEGRGGIPGAQARRWPEREGHRAAAMPVPYAFPAGG